ncbi:hypothetical protein BC828DRAFT_137621 [Blastocladiella britannica]|nr:hypothetical protein BC828DRAFT_137621 [Blastocladiella britannica]
MADLESIAAGLSAIERTPDGLHYAFVRLEAAGKNLGSADALADFPHLRFMDISANPAITSLAKGLAPQLYLLSLTATGNGLTAVEDSVFASKKYLGHLDLSENMIGNCQTTAWPHLQRLILNKNALEELVISHAPELLTLEARANKLSLVRLANPMQRLQKLYLAANQIIDVSFVMGGKSALESIHLRDNIIGSLLPFANCGLDKLSYLNLRNNKIDSFDEIDHLGGLKSLARLNLQQNPICEQENYRLNIVYRLAHLKVLDKEPIAADEREEGEQVRVQNERIREEQRQRMEAESASAPPPLSGGDGGGGGANAGPGGEDGGGGDEEAGDAEDA